MEKLKSCFSFRSEHPKKKSEQLDSVWFGRGGAVCLYQTRNWISTKSRAKVHHYIVVFKALIYISAFGHLICLQLLMIQCVPLLGYIGALTGLFFKFLTALTKWWKVARGNGQMDRVTHSGVSVASLRTLSSCILAERRWGLWPGREELSQKSVWWLILADSDGPGREGNLLILFDLWCEPENETEPPRELYGLLAAASGWSHRAQVRGISHRWLFYRTCFGTWTAGYNGAEDVMERFSCRGTKKAWRHPDEVTYLLSCSCSGLTDGRFWSW